MLKIFKSLISLMKKFAYRNEVSIGHEVIFGRHTYISTGSQKIRIGEKSKVYGRLIAQGDGEIILEENVQIGPGTTIGAISKVTIKRNALLANDIKVMDNNNHPVNPSDRLIMNSSPLGHVYKTWKYSLSDEIQIGENVWIGQDSRICKGVKIGDGSIVAANSVVTKDVPPNVIVAGNPARVVKSNIDCEKKLI